MGYARQTTTKSFSGQTAEGHRVTQAAVDVQNNKNLYNDSQLKNNIQTTQRAENTEVSNCASLPYMKYIVDAAINH